MAASERKRTFDNVPSENIIRTPRQRSPNYPAISLREAVERATKLYNADGRSGSPLEAAVKHFGFNRPHGTAMALVSALRKYGLVEVSNGRVTLTQPAVSIIVFPDDDPRKFENLRIAALAPEIYSELYNRYSKAGKLPSATTLKAELEAEMKFNPRAVADFVRDFKETLSYAGLLQDDGVTLRQLEGERPKIGDYVQWESNGVLHFSESKRVRAISEDGNFAFVDGDSTGLPMNELNKAPAPATSLDAKNLFRSVADSMAGSPVKEHSFNAWTLAPGVTAELRINGQISPDDLDVLRDYVEITIKALKRTSTKPDKE